MCLILHIETATDVCSVSIAKKGELISCKETREERSHAGTLAVFINHVLKESSITTANLNAVAVSMGPGSYTGLRIGISSAKGFCYGLGIPLIAVQTLDSMYYGFLNRLKIEGKITSDNDLIIPMLDARRMEVYTCIFKKDHTKFEKTQALIVNEDSFNYLLEDHVLYFFGSGSEKVSRVIHHPNAQFINDFNVSSIDMIPLAYDYYKKKKFEDVAYFEPYYLKDFITTTPKRKVF